MNEEDKIHINSFKFYDRDELEELTKEYYLENKKLKEQYCERTDCSGRIGNSKKIEQLETEKEQLNNLVNSCQKEIRRLKKELQALKTSDEEWLEKSDK